MQAEATSSLFSPHLREKQCYFSSWTAGTQELGGWGGEGSQAELCYPAPINRALSILHFEPMCKASQTLPVPQMADMADPADPERRELCPSSACAARAHVSPLRGSCSGAGTAPTPLHTKCCRKPFSWRERCTSGPPATVPLGARLHGLAQPRQPGTRVTLRLQLLCVHLIHPWGFSRIRAFPKEAAGSGRSKDSRTSPAKAMPSTPIPWDGSRQAGSRQSCCSTVMDHLCRCFHPARMQPGQRGAG